MKQRSLFLPIVIILCSCTTTFKPIPQSTLPFAARAQSQEENAMRVSVAVPSADEAKDIFGVNLYGRKVQPVWLEVSNMTSETISLLPVSIDADFLSPLEVSALFNVRKNVADMRRHFVEHALSIHVPPGATHSGYVYTNLDEGTKAFNVDLHGETRDSQFTFFVAVPGLAIDHHEVDFDAIYGTNDFRDYTDAHEFAAAVNALPCCTQDSKAKRQGDPLNLILIGEDIDLYYAFIRAGWDETEVVTLGSSAKTMLSFITGGEYRYSPVSSLYVFGRAQDIALQRIRENIHERNHFRVWLTPLTYNSAPVWVGQISRDIGVRFSRRTVTTHKIDPDVDETREYLLENLAYNQSVEQFAYATGVREATIDAPRTNLGDDPYFTDGLRLVMWIRPGNADLRDIRYVEWEDPEK